MSKNHENQNYLCFIRTDNGYEQITYAELCKRRNTDEEYKSKKFLPFYGMLMEVTEDAYRDFYSAKRRQKYITERSRKNGDFSYDMLTTDDFNGEDIIVDDREPLDEQVVRKVMVDKLRYAMFILPENEQELIRKIFFEELSERTLAEKYGVSQVAIHKRKVKILNKLKKLLEN